MGIFTRVRDIVNSNVNAALDKAEDPEKLVKYMIREMEDTLVELKAACAGVMAARKRTQRDSSRAGSSATHWASRSELAVERGRENLARRALKEKRFFRDEQERIDNHLDELDTIVGQYKNDIVQIEEKLGTARERQRILIQRHKRVVHHRRAQQEIRKFDTSQVFVRFDEFENRLDRAEAEADLVNYGVRSGNGLEDEFVQIEKDEEIEAELQALKQARQELDAAVSA